MEHGMTDRARFDFFVALRRELLEVITGSPGGSKPKLLH